jgi:hypothetical protein
VLLVVAGLLIALSLATRYGAYRAEVAQPGSTQVAAWKAVMRLFDVNSEGNVPSWFSSMLLMGCALVAAVLALVVGLTFVRFVVRLPPGTRRLVVAAAVLVSHRRGCLGGGRRHGAREPGRPWRVSAGHRRRGGTGDGRQRAVAVRGHAPAGPATRA